MNVEERQPCNDECYARRLLKREQLTSAVTPVLLQALALTPGERLLDIGCGTGGATLRAAEVIGPGGAVVGADISKLLVQRATQRAAEAGASNASFHAADMQTAQLDSRPFTAAMSQFGVMFFDEPVDAFANLRTHLCPSGRLCFACWQAADQNPWSFASRLTGILAPPPPATARENPTGPFALADPDHVHGLLRAAGFGQVEVTAHQATVGLPETAVFDDEELVLMGVPPHRMAQARDVVDAHLAQFREPSGMGRFPLAYLIVAARL